MAHKIICNREAFCQGPFRRHRMATVTQFVDSAENRVQTHMSGDGDVSPVAEHEDTFDCSVHGCDAHRIEVEEDRFQFIKVKVGVLNDDQLADVMQEVSKAVMGVKGVKDMVYDDNVQSVEGYQWQH